MGRAKAMGGSWAGRMRCARDMGSPGIDEDGRSSDRTQQGIVVTVVVVAIVRFQRSEGVRVRETRDW